MSPREELGDLAKRLTPEQRELLRSFAEDLDRGAARQRADLLEVAQGLGDAQVDKLLDVARAMALPIQETINCASDVVTPRFNDEFRARLQAHHATHTTPMDRLGFENAFLSASRAAGRSTSEAPSRTTRFYDATMDDVQIALKTEGAKSMKPNLLHISKLSEAAWIQDMRSARNRYEKTMQLMDDFLKAVGRLFVLRYYLADPAPHYELVEVPVEHFRLIRELPVEAFDSDAPKIAIKDERGNIMLFRIDRSDSKITIAKIQKSRCIVHATWRLAGMADDDALPLASG